MKFNNINFTKDILPHIIAVLVFLLITIGFFSPVFFDNMAINQHDITQWKGGAQSVIEYREQTGEETLWADGMFSGMPAYLVNANWSNGPVKVLHEVFSLGLPHPVRMIFIAFVSFYILLLSYKVRPYLAIAGAISFGLSSFLIIGLSAGHNARIGAIAYMPLVLAGIKLVFREKYIVGVAITSAALALHLRLNHLQVTYYLLFIVTAFGINELIFSLKNKNIGSFSKKIGVLVIAAIISLGTFTGELLATYQYSKYSTRGADSGIEKMERGGLSKNYVFEFSNGTLEWMTLFIPNILGGSQGEELSENSNVAKAMASKGIPQNQIRQQIKSLPTYWGNQRLTAPYYVGAISFLLFVIGIVFVNERNKWWLIAISILGIFISMGDNFSTLNYFLYDYLPLFNKFRSVTFTLIIPIFAINLLGIIGLETLFSTETDKKILKKFFISTGIAAGLCLFVILIAGAINTSGAIDQQIGAPAWFINALKQDRISLMRADSFRTLIYILIAACLIYFSLKKKISTYLAIIGIIALTLIDHWGIDSRYFGDKNFVKERNSLQFTKTPADETILKDSEPHYRVLNLANPFNEARTSYFHESIGGYHGAKMGNYQTLIEYTISPEIQQLINGLQAGETPFDKTQTLNMLNTKYIKFGDQAQQVIKNPMANGPAWCVEEVKQVGTPRKILDELSTIDTKSIAFSAPILSGKYPEPGKYDPNGKISLTNYQPNKLEYKASTKGKTLFVFSDIYYPEGWTAYVNGKETEIVLVNYVLRGLVIENPGEYDITFEFKPKVYYSLNPITAVSSWLMIIVFLGGLFYSVFKIEKI
ncbi:glycosyltransferase family protein [Marinigracilibium pacificum]|uniref:YfhO family protein n=1 Tax=Marinigracilibium pacificum TaxID=2729599 RepID=A0A848J0W0_9BACT|nr:hypothetical protein [Marinigracilibium pacificum]NMM49155.1 YfhO family protein [Marinigracilibium pacificum]